MYRRCIIMSRFDKNTFLFAWLCLVWIAGLSLGFVAARFYGDPFVACIQLAPASKPAFFGCLAVNVLPLLISACAVFFIRAIAYPLCFFRGVCLGLGMGAIACSYCDAGFLMAGLLQFSVVLFTPFFLWYFCRRLELGNYRFHHDTFMCLVVGFVVAGLDAWMVSPFLLEVINI